MKLLLLDNFDSFVYNIYQAVSSLGIEVEVFRNNEVSIAEIEQKKYDKIIISPGPGNPSNEKDFGICKQVITDLNVETPILGVCLGHQGIISAFGGTIVHALKPMHGKQSIIIHNEKTIFSGVKNPLRVMRYHSLIGNAVTLPNCLEITATSNDDNAIMAIQHKKLPIFGVQFHPESIMTEEGQKILKNFCNQ